MKPFQKWENDKKKFYVDVIASGAINPVNNLSRAPNSKMNQNASLMNLCSLLNLAVWQSYL